MDADNLHRRLKKIIGQLGAIDKMVDQDVPCEDMSRDREYLVFCEVKYRRTKSAGSALEAVDTRDAHRNTGTQTRPFWNEKPSSTSHV